MSNPSPHPTPFGRLLRLHREQLGLTQHILSTRTSTLDSSYISQIETGAKTIAHRGVVLKLADALELDSYATDHFLHVAGFATELDWQAVARDLLQRGGVGAAFIRLTRPYYETLAATPPEEDDPHDLPRAPTAQP